MKNFRQLLKYLKPYKKWAFLASTLIILEVIMDLLLPTIIKNVVNIGIGNNDFKYVIMSIGIMILLAIIGIAGGIGSAYFAAKASQNAGADLREALFEKISKLSFLNLDKIKTGHLITILTNDITLIANIMMMGLRFLVRVPIVFIGSTIMAIIISPKLSMILLILIPFVLILAVIIMTKAFPSFNQMQKNMDNVNTVVRENLGGIRVVKAFVTEDYESKKFKKANENLMNSVIKAIRIVTVAMPLMMLCINGAIIFVLWFGGKDVTVGAMQIGDIMAFIQYLTNILTSIMMASMVIVMLSRSEASSKRINDTFALENDSENIKNSISTEKIEGKVEFRNVSFNYEGGTGDAVLKNINFTVEPGEIVALLGATGSGKSTLVNLIPRFYDVTSGSILIDDIDIKSYNLPFLRKNVGIALQQTLLFSDTIKNNIKYGNDEASDEDVIKAAKIAEAHDFIMSKKSGYDYRLNQRGVNLSGGQKQRLAIARAILPNPKILILDDTTSAVDMKTEKKIRESLKKVMKNRTTFIVAQRISSAMDADKIIVLDDGMIVGMGTHKELLANNKIYQDIYNSQLKKDGDNLAEE